VKFDGPVLDLLERHAEGLTFNEILEKLRKQKLNVQNPQLSRTLTRLIRERKVERTLRLASYRLTWVYGKTGRRPPRIEWREIERVGEGLTPHEAEQIIDLTAASFQLFIRSLTMGSIDPKLVRSVFVRLEKESYWPEVRDLVHAMLGRFGCE